MKAKELLEQDRERFLGKLGTEASPADGVGAAEEELNRILYRYLTDETPAQTALMAKLVFGSVKAALPLMDEIGETKVFELSAENQPKDSLKKERETLLGASSLVLFLGAVLMSGLGKGNIIFVLLALCLGGAALFIVYKLGRQRGPAKKTRQAHTQRKIEKYLDAEKVYHDLSTLMTVVDEGLEEASLSMVADTHPEEETGPEVCDASVLDAQILALLASILESVYVSGEEAYAREVISHIRFYLHRYGIEMIDYSAERQKLFDLMPSLHERTIRPALVHDGVLQSKGLATLKTAAS